MKNLRSLNKYFIKYKWRFLLGLIFVSISGKFAVLSGPIISKILNRVQESINQKEHLENVYTYVLEGGLAILGFALLRGLFMFLMRQTIIVMSRHIEYDQKNEIYFHYQKLSTQFYKSNFTGDLMNRISEDVSRVRMYTGPTLMYFSNAVALAVFCIWDMIKVNWLLTIFVILPLPFLAISMYIVNQIIYNKSSKIQAQLSTLTTAAQESYSGIRVIRSFVQENNMIRFFNENSEKYRKSAISLSLTEAVYFPSMTLFIGLSMLCTILIGGFNVVQGLITIGNIAQFVFYINLLIFPFSAIGMIASMIQRASASQKRIDEFLQTEPDIQSSNNAIKKDLTGNISFSNITFTYPNTGITALNHFSFNAKAGQKIAIIGKTGSGKSTIGHLLLRMYDPQTGIVSFDGEDCKHIDLEDLRSQISYAPQDVYLFSDTIYNNIKFGSENASKKDVIDAAQLADLDKDIANFSSGYETVIGERGVMLSGGQKQRLVLARAILKKSKILILDECLSAVDTQTEKTILANLRGYLSDKTTIVITHRIFTGWVFDQILVVDDGKISEQGTHDELMQLGGAYAKLYIHQTNTD